MEVEFIKENLAFHRVVFPLMYASFLASIYAYVEHPELNVLYWVARAFLLVCAVSIGTYFIFYVKLWKKKKESTT
jgi:hypothetical protein